MPSGRLPWPVSSPPPRRTRRPRSRRWRVPSPCRSSPPLALGCAARPSPRPPQSPAPGSLPYQVVVRERCARLRPRRASRVRRRRRSPRSSRRLYAGGDLARVRLAAAPRPPPAEPHGRPGDRRRQGVGGLVDGHARRRRHGRRATSPSPSGPTLAGRRRLVAVTRRRHAQPRRRRAAVGARASAPTRARASRSSRTRADVLQVVGSTARVAAASWAWPATSGCRSAPAARARSTRPWSSAARRRSSRPSRRSRASRSRATSCSASAGFKKIVDEQGGIPIVIPRRSSRRTPAPRHQGRAADASPGAAGPRLRARAQDAARRRLRPVRHQGEVILAAARQGQARRPDRHPGGAHELQRGRARATSRPSRSSPSPPGCTRSTRCRSGAASPRARSARRRAQSIVVLGAEARTPLRLLPRREPLVSGAHTPT